MATQLGSDSLLLNNFYSFDFSYHIFSPLPDGVNQIYIEIFDEVSFEKGQC